MGKCLISRMSHNGLQIAARRGSRVRRAKQGSPGSRFTYFGTLPFSTVSIFILSSNPFQPVPSLRLPPALLSPQWLISTLLHTQGLLSSISILATQTPSSPPPTRTTPPARWSILHSLCLPNIQTRAMRAPMKITTSPPAPQSQIQNTSRRKQSPNPRPPS